jgi:glycosyltransferase involved in cell wall biosynthesis
MLSIQEPLSIQLLQPCRRVIHIVENLDKGAVENWLVRMLSYAQQQGQDCHWTFYCTLGKPGKLDERARAAGAQIIYSPVPLASNRAFVAALRSELNRGKYDVMHCHHDLMNAVYIMAAIGLPLRKRIAHAHNADQALPTPSLLKQSLLRAPMRRICQAADHMVGISRHTLDEYLAGRRRRPHRDLVHYYGVDPTPFQCDKPDRIAFREELALAPDSRILLFGGRITPEKNPVMTVDVLCALRQMDSRAIALFVGTGSLEEAVKKQAKSLGLESAIRMLGWRSDLPQIMACCDWFILPRPEKPMEGFGLAVVEAQLAGLRLLLSHGIPDDPLLPTACYRRLSLSQSANEWAIAAMQLLDEPTPTSASAIAALKASPMDMNYALQDLLKLHSWS